MPTELIVLGCGDSRGTPRIGNDWGNCDPNEPKNIRTRPSMCIQSETTTLVIDTGPDFKHQINRENIKKIDAILYTHAHSDHTNGIDDLKPFHDRTRTRVPVYLRQEVLDELRVRFNYIFEQKSPLYPSIVDVHVWSENDFYVPNKINDISFVPFLQDHGPIVSVGFRFGDVAYSTDLVNLNADSIASLKGIKTWVVDGGDLYSEKPLVHLNLKKVLELNELIGAEQVYLSHVKGDHDYQTMLKNFPSHVRPAHDGLRLTVNY